MNDEVDESVRDVHDALVAMDQDEANVLYVSLHTADPRMNGACEVVARDYIRRPVMFDHAARNSGITLLVDSVVARSDWGTITHAAIFDAPTDGSMLVSIELVPHRAVDEGVALSLQISLEP